MKGFQRIESKETPEVQRAALQGSFRFPAVYYPFAKYVLTHCHLSYQNISRESRIATREFCCRSHHPHLDSYFTLCTALPFLFIISCRQQPVNRWCERFCSRSSSSSSRRRPCALCCSPARAGLPLAAAAGSVLQGLGRGVMNDCSAGSVSGAGLAALSHRAELGHRSEACAVCCRRDET